LDNHLIKGKSSKFLFKVKRDSVIEESIEDGDKLVLDQSLRCHHKDIVAATVDGEYTIKRLFKQRGRIEFHPENRNYPAVDLQLAQAALRSRELSRPLDRNCRAKR